MANKYYITTTLPYINSNPHIGFVLEVVRADAMANLIIHFTQAMEQFKPDEALKILWDKLRADDEILTQQQPWKLTDKNELKKILEPVAQDILNTAFLLRSLLPDTAARFIKQFSANKIIKDESLFLRLS